MFARAYIIDQLIKCFIIVVDLEKSLHPVAANQEGSIATF